MMMRKISADWVFPVHRPPIFRGVIVLGPDDSILDILDPERVEVGISDIEQHDGILCPGFVNTHVHLELSYLQGYIERNRGLDHFIRQVWGKYRLDRPGQGAGGYPMQAADTEMQQNGIIAAGDIVGFKPSPEHREVKEASSIYYHSFAEVYGSRPEQAAKQFLQGLAILKEIRSFKRNRQSSLAPHSTYSLSTDLWRLVKNHLLEEKLPSTMHHLESEDEVDYLREGKGPIQQRLVDFGITIIEEPIRGERPLMAIADFLPGENKLLLVHNTVAREEDLLLASRLLPQSYFCLCPNANLFIEGRLPNIGLFRAFDNRVCLGTDSLASNTGLSILEEMKTLQKAFPALELETLLRWGCLNGAEYLGIEHWAGSLEKGKSPGICLIECCDTGNLRLSWNSRVKQITRSHPS